LQEEVQDERMEVTEYLDVSFTVVQHSVTIQGGESLFNDTAEK
jgi:hypothetical protein